MGRVSSYDGWDYTWTRGKLSSIRKSSGGSSRALITPVLLPSKTYSFTYNGFGQRVSKSYSYFLTGEAIVPLQPGETTHYTKQYHYDQSGRLLVELINETRYGDTDVSKSLKYLYDESGIIGVQYTSGANTNTYYYLRNLLGDVIGIYNTSGTKVVGYTYDAWGNCTIDSLTTNYDLAHDNPIRYRGYYYDEDTGLYYLNARYYNPEWRRFISPDDTSYLDYKTPNGLNLYCYCNNDPINYADPSGHLAFWIITALIGAAIGVGITAAVDFIPDQEFNLHWGWYVGAGVLGAAVGAGIGMAISYSATGTLTASFTDIRFGYALRAAQNGDYSKLAKFATHNNHSNKVGLGKYIEGSPKSYEVLSRKYGYTYYNMPQKYYSKAKMILGDDNMWIINQTFLDQQMALNKIFIPLSQEISGAYKLELIYVGLLGG